MSLRGLSVIFEWSWEFGEVSVDWKMANIVPGFKKGKKDDLGNYRSVSVTSMTGKIMEKIIWGGLEGIVSKFPHDTKLGGIVNSLEGREALQRVQDKSEKWAITNCMKFNKDKSWTLHLRWGNPGCTYRLGNETLESSTTERHLEILVHGKLNMSQQCPGSQEGKPCPGGIRHNIASQSREGLSCSALHWGGLTLDIVCSLGHHNIKNI
ncbi:rna-directed dna polymerase from mobile element jockey-like [Willisornis vidua]|uniref:Rna-directed dna polymerase from mobile element jockey-like n=1 Tax=Willisornis vidua TaxID=1566151 RepID=A0ABQ9D7L7_9PASS|nr:rna-directed dna polymerase from mobile element jockey-like [Willisornis vidua]